MLSSLASNRYQENTNDIWSRELNYDCFSRSISLKDVEEVIDEMSPKKSTGPNGLPVLSFSKLFNSVNLLMLYPPQWKLPTSITVPNPSRPENCRPISILNVEARILEKILAKRLTLFIDTNKLPKQQFGFRSKQSAVMQVENVRSLLEPTPPLWRRGVLRLLRCYIDLESLNGS